MRANGAAATCKGRFEHGSSKGLGWFVLGPLVFYIDLRLGDFAKEEVKINREKTFGSSKQRRGKTLLKR